MPASHPLPRRQRRRHFHLLAFAIVVALEPLVAVSTVPTKIQLPLVEMLRAKSAPFVAMVAIELAQAVAVARIVAVVDRVLVVVHSQLLQRALARQWTALALAAMDCAASASASRRCRRCRHAHGRASDRLDDDEPMLPSASIERALAQRPRLDQRHLELALWLTPARWRAAEPHPRAHRPHKRSADRRAAECCD